MALQRFTFRLYVSVAYCKSRLFQIQKHRPLMAEKFLVRTGTRARHDRLKVADDFTSFVDEKEEGFSWK